VDSSGLGNDTVASSCRHATEPSCSINNVNVLTTWATTSFSNRTLLYGVSSWWFKWKSSSTVQSCEAEENEL